MHCEVAPQICLLLQDLKGAVLNRKLTNILAGQLQLQPGGRMNRPYWLDGTK